LVLTHRIPPALHHHIHTWPQELDGELEERTRLLARTKASMESLQNDLARAHAAEDSARAATRGTADAQTRRVAELERALLHARGDHGGGRYNLKPPGLEPPTSSSSSDSSPVDP
jgi:septal ring factor EnvC (AmiA/AmiB activator)